MGLLRLRRAHSMHPLLQYLTSLSTEHAIMPWISGFPTAALTKRNLTFNALMQVISNLQIGSLTTTLTGCN